MKKVKGGVTRPTGFRANGVACGIKRSGKPDLALIVSEVPAAGAAVFTKNSVKAAPVVVSQRHARDGRIQAIIANSGNANCFTGEFGWRYAEEMAGLIQRHMGIPRRDVIVASTGIISKPLPYDKIAAASEELVRGLSRQGGAKAARAILTTDTCVKEIAVQIELGGCPVFVGACAKGSGMIAPDMATMLCFVTTDAAVEPSLLKKALRRANEQSFNAITVDGSMSTNDMVVVMANGLSENSMISKENKDFDTFCAALDYVCLEMAKKIVLDGEGATKFLEIRVKGAQTDRQAKLVAMKIANCNLVKTAAYGSNPNWGRVAAAIGALGIKAITEKNLNIHFSSFKKRHIHIDVDLNLGDGAFTAYTSDLSEEYIRINAEYN